MPRITTKALPAFCVSTSVMFGTSAMKSAGLVMPAASIVCSVNTLMVTGTSRNASSRLRAVTTTSSSVPACAYLGLRRHDIDGYHRDERHNDAQHCDSPPLELAI